MPQIGWFEILVVMILAILIIGPKDFPIMLKKLGSWIGTAKRYISNIQSEVTDLDLDKGRDLFNTILITNGIEQGEFIDKEGASKLFTSYFKSFKIKQIKDSNIDKIMNLHHI